MDTVAMDDSYPYNLESELMAQAFDGEVPEEYMDGYYEDGYYGDGYYDEEYDGYEGGDYDPYADEDLYYQRITAGELFDQCVIPTISQACTTIFPLLGLCFASRITNYLATDVLHGSGAGKFIAHSSSALFGVLALHLFFKENLIYMLMLALLAYSLLFVTDCKCRGLSGITVSIVTVVYLITCEILVVKETEWHQIRGAQMVLSMKIISLAFDLSNGTVVQMPGLLEYVGYVFHVGSVIFGPWVSYQEYAHLLTQKERRMNYYWVAKLTKSFLLSLVCLVASMCFVRWQILDTAFIWVLAYRDAQSFRFSHYFVCFLMELTASTTGLGASKNNGDVRWDLSVARPLHIEVPRSLVEVVTNWNLPWHHWLKTYVFKTAKPLGTLPAILLTYVASSLLHGINFQLCAVLLSIGCYSYVDFVLRNKMSKAFSACLQAKRCKAECDHVYKSNHPYVFMANLWFGLISMFHLAYLGLMFDSSPSEEKGYNMQHTLSKWEELGFASHWVVLATYIFYLLI